MCKCRQAEIHKNEVKTDFIEEVARINKLTKKQRLKEIREIMDSISLQTWETKRSGPELMTNEQFSTISLLAMGKINSQEGII